MTRPKGPARWTLTALVFVLLPAAARGAGFFDGVPRKGYLKADVSLDVLDAAAGQAVVARLRYVRLALDPGRRDIAWDYWPEREMLLVERTTGEKLVFERLSKLPDPDPSTPAPRGRIGLAGTAVETFARPASSGTSDPCAALDVLIHAGNVEIPIASADLGTKTVRVGIALAVEGAFGPNERELIAQTVPVLVAAQSQGLSAAPLEVLDILFPGQPFARAAQGLSFRPSGGALLNPADGAWRSVTDAPEMLQGVPVY